MEVRNIKVSQIDVRGRVREDFGDLKSLADSITLNGLIEPIAVCPNQNDRTYPFKLVGGERRLRAIKMFLKWDMIPAHIMKNLKDMESILSVERAENVDRKDFTDSEKIKLTARFTEIIGDRRKLKPGKGKVVNCPLIEVPKGTKTRDTAAKFGGFESSTDWRRAVTVQKNGTPGLIKMVDSGRVARSAAAEVAEGLSKSDQVEVVAAGPAAVRDAARKLREKRQPTADNGDEFMIIQGGKIVPIEVQIRLASPTSQKRYVSINADHLWEVLTTKFGYLSLQAGEMRNVQFEDKDGFRLAVKCKVTEAVGQNLSLTTAETIRIQDPMMDQRPLTKRAKLAV
jgi:stage V sporulation protein SpoVS